MPKARHAETRLRNCRDAVPAKSSKQPGSARLRELWGMRTTR